MSNYNYDKYAIPNKWIADDFEKLANLCEQCREEKRKRAEEACPQFEPKKGN